jgi:RNA-directed DNA polymerase
MRKWYSLYDNICTDRNLWRAWKRVEANDGAPGCDGQTVAQFGATARERLRQLRQELRTKTYRPRPVRRVRIPKPDGGERALGIPCVRDRIVQVAVAQILEPIYDPQFSRYSHGFRPGKGCHTALEIVDQALRAGYTWVVEVDIRRFFDTVDHEVLLATLSEQIVDGSVLHLLRAFLRGGVLVDPGDEAPELTERGTPQGGPLSPLLANIYLHAFDTALRAQRIPLVRYADDVVLFATSRQEAEAQLACARQVLEGPLKLTLHPTKTRVVSIDDGFAFLGFRYVRDQKGRLQKGVRAEALARFRARIRALTPRHAGQRRRPIRHVNPGWARKHRRLSMVIQAVNTYLQSWGPYYYHAATSWNWGRELDQFVRRRLRSLAAGRFAKGVWHQLLPNALFTELGLTSVEANYLQAHQGRLDALCMSTHQA